MAHLRTSFMILVVVLFMMCAIASAQSEPTLADYNCSDTGDTYATNSTYHQNLDLVLANLTFAASTLNSKFSNTSLGQTDDDVYALYLCRGDLSPEDCSLCIVNATDIIRKFCPNQKDAIIWFHECMLRFANHDIFSRVEESPSYNWIPASTFSAPAPPPPSSVNVGFNLSSVVYDLINETAFGRYDSLDTPAFTTRQDNVTGGWKSQVLYSLAQCTPDISPTLCNNCLSRAFDTLKACCSSSIQALAYLPSCQLRYDTDLFFRDASRVAQPISPSPSRQSENDQKTSESSPRAAKIAIPVAVGALLFLTLCTFFFVKSGYCSILQKQKFHQGSTSELITMESLQFDFDIIKAATDNFSTTNKLGQGGFGAVYKGRLQNGEEIAVKRLSPKSRQGIHEFKTEVLLVAKLQHKNLVRLLGFCATEEKLLVYEFLPKSSLDHHLFDSEKHEALDWATRYKIIDGIAKGLLYLHEDSRLKIVHRDLKPSNILLDRDMTPKISDFGMAKIFGEDGLQDISNRIVGTRGYMAPEYVRTGTLSFKSDVYSFGVLVLEIVSGRRLKDGFFKDPEGDGDLLECAWRLWNAKEPTALVDSTLCGNFMHEEAQKCIHLGLCCIQEEAQQRPTMGSIVSILNSHSSNLPQLSPEGHYKSGRSSSPDWLRQSSSNYSGNDDITILSGR